MSDESQCVAVSVYAGTTGSDEVDDCVETEWVGVMLQYGALPTNYPDPEPLISSTMPATLLTARSGYVFLTRSGEREREREVRAYPPSKDVL